MAAAFRRCRLLLFLQSAPSLRHIDAGSLSNLVNDGTIADWSNRTPPLRNDGSFPARHRAERVAQNIDRGSSGVPCRVGSATGRRRLAV